MTLSYHQSQACFVSHGIGIHIQENLRSIVSDIFAALMTFDQPSQPYSGLRVIT